MPDIQDWHSTNTNYTMKPDCEVLCTSRSLGITFEPASFKHAAPHPFEEPLSADNR